MEKIQTRRLSLFSTALAVVGAAATASAAAAEPREDLAVLTRWPRYQHSRHALYNYLADQAIERLQRRSAEVDSLRTAGGWRERRGASRHHGWIPTARCAKRCLPG